MEDIEEKKIEQRKEKISNWLKDRDNLLLIGVLIFSLIILMYYFNLTKSQVLWHDEAEYMSAAKSWAFGIPYDIHPARPPLFSFLIFLLYLLNFKEAGIRFSLEIIPMLFVVFFTYLFVKELYDKKTALITSFITSISWIHLFYTMRLMTDILGLLFGLLSLFFFWKGYVKDQGKYYIWLVGFFIALSFMCRLTGVLYGGIIFIFLLLTTRLTFLKNKNLWMTIPIFILTISPYLIWSYYYHGNALAFRSGYGGTAGNPIGWYMIRHLFDYPELGFFILFLIGLLTCFPMLLSLDLIFSNKEKKYNNDLFSLATIIFILLFFIFFLRLAENRWLIAMSIGIFIFSAKGVILIYEFLKKKSNFIAISMLLVLLLFGAYFELKHADAIIKNKIDSYSPVKEAALWMKDNSNKDDLILTASVPQTVYYSERRVMSYYNSSAQEYFSPEQLKGVISLKKPKYAVVSVFEPSNPQWTLTFPQENSEMFRPVKIWFGDAEQKQPILIIYEVNYRNNSI